jgi:large subunit ribosomal protein L24
MRGRQKKRKHEGVIRLKKGDKVAVIAGADRGKGPVEILRVDRDHGRVTVQGVNVRTKHERKSQKNP